MKKFFLLAFLFFLSLCAFSQPVGLSFYGRYLTDSELDAKPSVKVTIPFYNDFEHEALTSEDDYSFFLNTYFDYKKRHFIVEEDVSGVQWIHLSSRGAKERINAISKYAKSQVNNRIFYDFEKPMAISFDWCANISDSPAKNASITVVKITATSQTPNPVPAYIVCTDKILYLKVKEYDLRESYEARSTTNKIKLCPYEYGKIAHIRLELNGKTVSAFVDGEKKGEYTFEHELWGKFQFKMSTGQEHFGDFFNEAFFGNIEVGEIVKLDLSTHSTTLRAGHGRGDSTFVISTGANEVSGMEKSYCTVRMSSRLKMPSFSYIRVM